MQFFHITGIFSTGYIVINGSLKFIAKQMPSIEPNLIRAAFEMMDTIKVAIH